MIYWPDIIWHASSYGRQQSRDLSIMHKFTKTLIKERWNRHKELKIEYGNEFNQIMFGDKKVRKNRIAFLGIFKVIWSKMSLIHS